MTLPPLPLPILADPARVMSMSRRSFPRPVPPDDGDELIIALTPLEAAAVKAWLAKVGARTRGPAS